MFTYLARKIASLMLMISLMAPSLSPLFASGTVDFNVKISAAGDETYDTSASNISHFNTDLTFQFVDVSGGGAEEYSLNLPAGFTYQSNDTIGTTCAGFSILNASDGNYHFSFNGAPGCIAKTTFIYRVTATTTAGAQDIFLLSRN